MFSVQEIRNRRLFWLTNAGFTFLFMLANYHYSYSNQMPADGALTIGFPLPWYSEFCGMMAGQGVSCGHSPFWLSAGAFLIDLILVFIAAFYASKSMFHFAKKDYVKKSSFWLWIFALTLLLMIAMFIISGLYIKIIGHSNSTIGFPLGYLDVQVGDRLNKENFLFDLIVYFVVSFLCISKFFTKKVFEDTNSANI